VDPNAGFIKKMRSEQAGSKLQQKQHHPRHRHKSNPQKQAKVRAGSK